MSEHSLVSSAMAFRLSTGNLLTQMLHMSPVFPLLLPIAQKQLTPSVYSKLEAMERQ